MNGKRREVFWQFKMGMRKAWKKTEDVSEWRISSWHFDVQTTFSFFACFCVEASVSKIRMDSAWKLLKRLWPNWAIPEYSTPPSFLPNHNLRLSTFPPHPSLYLLPPFPLSFIISTFLATNPMPLPSTLPFIILFLLSVRQTPFIFIISTFLR